MPLSFQVKRQYGTLQTDKTCRVTYPETA